MIQKVNEKNLLFIQVACPILPFFLGARLRKMVPGSESSARLRIKLQTQKNTRLRKMVPGSENGARLRIINCDKWCQAQNSCAPSGPRGASVNGRHRTECSAGGRAGSCRLESADMDEDIKSFSSACRSIMPLFQHTNSDALIAAIHPRYVLTRKFLAAFFFKILASHPGAEYVSIPACCNSFAKESFV